MSQSRPKTIWPTLILMLCSSFFWMARTYWIGPPYSSDGFGALGNAVYAIALTMLVLLLAGAAGSRVLRIFPALEWTSIERISLSLSLGLGVFGYITFAMGLAGFIQPVHFFILFVITSIIISTEFNEIISHFNPTLRSVLNLLTDLPFGRKILMAIGAGIILLTLFQSLTPPFNYDALMYHLQGPRLFLEAGRILPLYDNWLTFYPFTGEMVNLLGLALGSDTFARLIHLSTLMLILLSTLAMARRILPNSDGFFAAAILTGIPVLFLWGSQANNDLTLVLFQLLAIFLLLIWVGKKQNGYLILAGILQGLALGSKYLAFSGLGILLFIILINQWDPIKKRIDLQKSLRPLILFAAAALLVASPWYIKNLIWTGNPVYPFFFPNIHIDPLQLDLWSAYMNSYGTGKSWLDYLLLPINLYLKPGVFSTWFGVIDFPSPLFALAVLYPFAIRSYSPEKRKTIHLLAIITVLQFMVWAVGSQQTRFLFLLYPGLSILACCSLIWFGERFQYGRKIVFGTVAALMLVSLTVVSAANLQVNPYKILFGGETKQQFLSRMVSDYDGMQFIQTQLPADARVLMLWDGQSYYCDARCVPDLFQSQWTAFYRQNPTVSSMRNWLQTKGITHLLLNQSDTEFFQAHDPDNSHGEALSFFRTEFAPNCTKPVFQDESVEIFEFVTDGKVCR